jgi:hypothetical protein
LETASKLKKAGISFALQSGYEIYVPKTRVVLFEAAIAAANGLSQKMRWQPLPSTLLEFWESTTASVQSKKAKMPI